MGARVLSTIMSLGDRSVQPHTTRVHMHTCTCMCVCVQVRAGVYAYAAGLASEVAEDLQLTQQALGVCGILDRVLQFLDRHLAEPVGHST